MTTTYSNNNDNTIDNETIWRYQLIKHTYNDVSEVSVHPVAVSKYNPNTIKYLLDSVPIDLTAFNSTSMLRMMQEIKEDIQEYGVIDFADLENANITIGVDDEDTQHYPSYNNTVYLDDDGNYNDEYLDEYLDDNCYDEDHNVVDLVEFMMSNNR